MKSCCNNCKKGKPCGSDMAPSSLSGAFRRRSVGYGVYGDAVAPVAVPAPAPVAESKKIFGLEPKLAYLLGAVVLLKVLL